MNTQEKSAAIYSSLRRWVSENIGGCANLQPLDICQHINGGAYHVFTARVDFGGTMFRGCGRNEVEIRAELGTQLDKYNNQKNS